MVCCLVICGCVPKKAEPPTKTSLSPEQAAESRRTIITWLECEECSDGELEAVVKLGSIAVPSLAIILREGPSRANRELQRRHLMTTYQRLKSYQAKHPELVLPMSEEQFVGTYMDNYAALYQSRAAMGLAAMGGTDAKRAIEDAAKVSFRDDVKATVQASMEKLSKYE